MSFQVEERGCGESLPEECEARWPYFLEWWDEHSMRSLPVRAAIGAWFANEMQRVADLMQNGRQGFVKWVRYAMKRMPEPRLVA